MTVSDRVDRLNTALIETLDRWLSDLTEREAEALAAAYGDDPQNDLRALVAREIDDLTGDLDTAALGMAEVP